MWFVVFSSPLGGAPFKIERHSRVPLILSWKSSGGCPFGRQKMAEGGMLDAGGGGGGGDGVVVLWCCIWSPRKRQEAELWGAAIGDLRPSRTFLHSKQPAKSQLRISYTNTQLLLSMRTTCLPTSNAVGLLEVQLARAQHKQPKTTKRRQHLQQHEPQPQQPQQHGNTKLSILSFPWSD